MIIVRGFRQSPAVLLGEVRSLGGEQLSGQVARVGFVVDALACLAVFELGVGGEEALVVGWAAEGIFAAGLGCVSIGSACSNERDLRGRRSVCGQLSWWRLWESYDNVVLRMMRTWKCCRAMDGDTAKV